MKARNKFILLIIIASFLFIFNLGSSSLFDWDEINFAEAAREMIVTGNYLTVQIDYKAFHEKPPLFFWLQAVSMKQFGITSFAARLPNAIAGLLTLLTLFLIGKKEKDEEQGFIWSFTYFSSILPFFYFKFGIIDPVFNLFIFISLYLFYVFYKTNYFTNLLLSSLFCGLAIMTKGPVALLIIGFVIFIFGIVKKEYMWMMKNTAIFAVLSLLPYFLWYYTIYLQGNLNIFMDFWHYQLRLLNSEDAGHGGPFYYHFIVILIGCFPASLYFLSDIKNQFKNKEPDNLILILFVVVLFIFSIVKTKIVHYSSLAYFPVTYFAAIYLRNVFENKDLRTVLKIFILSFTFILSIAVIIFPNILLYIQDQLTTDINSTFIKDTFTRELLSKPVYWDSFELIPPFLSLIGVASAIFFIIKRNDKNFVYSIGATIVYLIFTVQSIYSPKVEEILQGTKIEYLQSLKGKDVYFKVLGYKTYTQYFYGEKSPEQSLNIKDEDEFLLKGRIDKDAYFICKSKDTKNYTNDSVKVINSRYGYALLKRDKFRY